MKIVYLVLIIVLVFAGCAAPPGSPKYAAEIHYMQDCNTGLCFARATNNYQGYFANAPCVEVKDHLENKCE